MCRKDYGSRSIAVPCWRGKKAVADVLPGISLYINRDFYFSLDFQGPGKLNYGIHDNYGCVADILQHHEAGGEQGHDYGKRSIDIKRA